MATVFIAFHLTISSLTLFRLALRGILYFLWVDDYVIGLSIIGNILILERLFSFGMSPPFLPALPPLFLIIYHLSLARTTFRTSPISP